MVVSAPPLGTVQAGFQIVFITIFLVQLDSATEQPIFAENELTETPAK